MSNGLILALIITLLILLLLTEVPIAFALASSGTLGIVLVLSSVPAQSALAAKPFDAVANYSLIAIPMFVAMGVLARYTRIAKDSYNVAARVLHKIPGGLGMATVASCAAFSAVSGSAMATVASVGRLGMEEMRRFGYDKRLAGGLISIGGTIDCMIPPSIVLVMYGLLSGESIGRLLMAGITPGILTGGMYFLAIGIIGRLKPHLVGKGEGNQYAAQAAAALASTAPPGASLPKRFLLAARGWIGVIEALVIFIAVMGGLYGGYVTATEAAAVGAMATLLMMILEGGIHQRGLVKKLKDSLTETIGTVSFVFALVVGGSIFTYFLLITNTPTNLAKWIIGLDLSGSYITLLILACFIPLGMFLDSFSILLIMIPLTYPSVIGLGYDGVWYGIMVVMLIEIGLVTPPVGICVFVAAGTAEDVTVEEVFTGVMWFLPFAFLTVFILFFFPEISLWLPDLAFGKP